MVVFPDAHPLQQLMGDSAFRYLPDIGGKLFDEVAVVDDSQDGPFKLGQSLLKSAARGNV